MKKEELNIKNMYLDLSEIPFDTDKTSIYESFGIDKQMRSRCDNAFNEVMGAIKEESQAVGIGMALKRKELTTEAKLALIIMLSWKVKENSVMNKVLESTQQVIESRLNKKPENGKEIALIGSLLMINFLNNV